MKFCGHCGQTLAAACPECGFENPPAFRFCGECGTPLAGGTDAPSAAPKAPKDLSTYTPKHLAEKILHLRSALEGERKQVSVLFADVKGSMELAEQLDNEEWHAVLERFFEILNEGVHRFEGTVNQYTGDGIMALFGAPIAHEDHAQRACYAALHLSETLGRYADELRRERGLNFSTRIGLNSGEVVVGKIGDDLRMDYTAQGHTVGLAQRIEQLCEPGRVYLSDETERLVRGYFALHDLGEFSLKGSSAPVRIHRLDGTGAARTRLDVSRDRGLTKFVGRADEMAILESALARARQGHGQVVGVVGEAGVGKSRLCYEFVERCRTQELPVFEAHCPAHGRNVPFLPILELFRNYFGIADDTRADEARQRIAGAIVLLDPGLRETLPTLFDFLGVGDPDEPAPAADAESRQRQIFAVMHRLARARSERGIFTVILIDDLHWIDPGSDQYVAQLVDAFEGSHGLLVLNFRPEYQAAWAGRAHYQQLPLVALGVDAVRELVESLLGTDPSVVELPARVQAWTEGNPFFTEEVIQTLIEDGQLLGDRGAYRLVTDLGRLEVPTSVHGVLAARIDRLPEVAKQVLQTASVIGKEFSEPLLDHTANVGGAELAPALDRLRSADFIYERSLYPVAEYSFKHPLSHEVAYESQLRERRRATHARVAEALAGGDPARLDEMSALIAHHYERAERAGDAARWHERAGAWTLISDPSASFHHWGRVRDLVKELGADPESLSRGAHACSQLLNISWRVGRPAEDGIRAFEDGKDFATRAGDTARLALLHGGYAAMRGLTLARSEEYVEHGLKAVRLADQTDDPELRSAMRTWLTHGYLFHGDFEDARRVSGEALALMGDDPDFAQHLIGLNARAVEMIANSVSRAWLGEPIATVRPAIEAAIAFATEHASREPEVYARSTYAVWCLLIGDERTALAQGRAAFRVSERLSSSDLLWATWSVMATGRALLANGHTREALETLESLIATVDQVSPEHVNRALAVASFADALRVAGRLDEARARSEEALRYARDHTLEWDLLPWFAAARARLAGGDLEGVDEVLRDVGVRIAHNRARLYEPQLHRAQADLAERRGDADRSAAERQRARAAFLALGAESAAARV